MIRSDQRAPWVDGWSNGGAAACRCSPEKTGGLWMGGVAALPLPLVVDDTSQ